MRRIVVAGDSHIVALEAALREAAPIDGVDLSVYRLTKIKNGRLIGSVSLPDLLLICKHLDPGDTVVSLIGGNQHAALGLIQHPQPFDFADASGGLDLNPGDELVPRSALSAVFERGLRGNDAKRVMQIAAAGPHRTVHLQPPPPKADEAHILKRVETDFLAAGIFEKGISPAALRHKLWTLQNEVMRAILAEEGIEVLPPPDGTTTDDGFLATACYAPDATHANVVYGTAVLSQILAVGGSEARAATVAL